MKKKIFFFLLISTLFYNKAENELMKSTGGLKLWTQNYKKKRTQKAKQKSKPSKIPQPLTSKIIITHHQHIYLRENREKAEKKQIKM